MLNGTIITVAHEALDERFNISEADFPHSYWPVSTWAIGAGLFSFTILPLMEDFGFRRVFLGTYGVFLCFLVPQAVAQNFATLVSLLRSQLCALENPLLVLQSEETLSQLSNLTTTRLSPASSAAAASQSLQTPHQA